MSSDRDTPDRSAPRPGGLTREPSAESSATPDVDARSYLEILRRFEGCRVGVVGDMVADVYVYGQPQRLSREAPVIVVRWESETMLPGSAANTVANLAALGARVVPVAVLGDDEPGRVLCRHLGELGVDARGLLVHPDVGTITKTRILAGDHNRTKQQVIRIDREPQTSHAPAVVDAVLELIAACDREVDTWIVSDYDYGLVSGSVIARLNELARSKPVVVDSHHQLARFRDVALATPNEEEALVNAGEDETAGDPVAAGRRLLELTRAGAVLVTRGNRGMVLLEGGGREAVIPAVGGVEVVDVSGAGDTVAATAGLALVAGASHDQAARLANLAAGIVVMQTGAATCTRQELSDRLRHL